MISLGHSIIRFNRLARFTNLHQRLLTRCHYHNPSITSTMKFIDIGANLTDEMYQGSYNGKQYHPPDLEAVLSRAWAAGLDRIIVTAGTLQQSRDALELCSRDPRLFCTVGCHPTRAGEFDAFEGGPRAYLDALLEVAREGIQRGKTVAVGECGLDYDRLQFCDAETQKRNFALQFELQRATGLPMFLHMRAATEDFVRIMKQEQGFGVPGVVHSFDGSSEELSAVLSINPGIYVGINGCSLKTDDNARVAGTVPLDRLMVETDCPYCEVKNTHAGKRFVTADVGQKDKKKHDMGSLVKGRNEPCRIGEVVQVIAGARGEAAAAGATLEEVAAAAYANTLRVFFPSAV